MQELKAAELFDLIHGVFTPSEKGEDITTNKGLNNILKRFNEAAKKYDREDLQTKLTAIVNDWQSSDEYKNVLNCTTKEHQKVVAKKMNTLIQETIPKIISEFIDDPKSDLFGDLIKKCAQAQQQEMLNGYLVLNGEHPSRERVVDQNINNIITPIEDYNKKYRNTNFFNVTTESTEKNQHKDFIDGVHAKTTYLNFSDWNKQLDSCCETGIIHPILDWFDPQLKKTQEAVKAVKQSLNTYANALIANAVSLENDQPVLETALHDIAAVEKNCRYNQELSSVLNGIIIQLKKHTSYRQRAHLIIPNPSEVISGEIIEERIKSFPTKALMSHEQLFKIECDKLGHSWEKETRPEIKNIYALINIFSERCSMFTDPNDRFESEKIVLNLIEAFEPIANASAGLINENELAVLKEDFARVAHTQDPWMSEHRTHYGWYADIVTAVLTLGLSSLVHWAYKSCVPATKFRDGWFNLQTTREQYRDAMVEAVQAIEATQPQSFEM